MPHASVNGIRLYYEIHGVGEPLVLLHGGVAASEAFGPNLPALAAGRQVVAVHLQGHGFTPDVEGRPFRLETMADDVAALIDHLGFGAADVLGYSMGAGVAFQVAVRHLDRVRRLILVSRAIVRDGWYPEGLAGFDRMTASAPTFGAAMAATPLASVYPDVDWVNLFTKMGEMVTQPYDWMDALVALPHPLLLVFADADAIRPEHIAEVWRRLGGGVRDAGLDGKDRPKAQLAVVPGATHYTLLHTPAVAEIAERFLSAGEAGGA